MSLARRASANLVGTALPVAAVRWQGWYPVATRHPDALTIPQPVRKEARL